MGTYLLTASQSVAAFLPAWAARLQRSLDSAMTRAEGASTGSGAGVSILIIVGVIAVLVLCLFPICIIAILTLLGPAIGNVFSNITNNI